DCDPSKDARPLTFCVHFRIGRVCECLQLQALLCPTVLRPGRKGHEMKVNQSNTESKKFQIPMMVTDEVIRDFGIKPEDVTWRRIGNRKCRVVMVDASEEEYKAYMAPIWAGIK